MPVYEFYCSECHAIFNFLSRRVNTSKIPACPRCRKPDLEKQVSPFAISKNLQEQTDAMPDLDESKMEQVMMAMAGDMENINEEDPKAMANFMRRFSSLTGMSLGDGAEEALSRLEAGEDPEQIEAEMGDLLEQDDLIALPEKKGAVSQPARPAPYRDETLYDL